MSSPPDPAALALAGELVVSRVERKLRVAGVATSALPVALEYIYAALRDADGRVIDVPGARCQTDAGQRHELALERVVGAAALAAARSVELAVPYRIEVSAELARARLAPPGRDGRVPLEITMRGDVPFVELRAIAAYFTAGRGLTVYVELEVRRGARATSCRVTGRVQEAVARADASTGICELWLPYDPGTATELDLAITVQAAGIGRIGPLAVAGL